LSLYHFKSTKNYDFSIKHTKQYIDICRDFHQNFDCNVLISSYKNAALVHENFGNYLEQLKYLERTANIQIKLNGITDKWTEIFLKDVYRKLEDNAKADYLTKKDKLIIRNRGVFQEETFAIKTKIQTFLNYIQKHSSRGYWIYQGWNIILLEWVFSDHGVGKYSELEKLTKVLSENGVALTEENLEIKCLFSKRLIWAL
jgi:hypothetical protein